MANFLFFIVLVCIGWIAWRANKQLPIIPFGLFAGSKKSQKDGDGDSNSVQTDRKANKKLIRSMLGIQTIKMNMLHLPKNTYVMALRCEPVNYHLRNPLEQEGIDARFEAWLTSIDYPVVWHIQNRFLDLSNQYNQYLQNIENDTLLNDKSRQYCHMVLQYMSNWLQTQPRYEAVRYVLFPYTLPNPKADKQDNTERALRELLRRANSGMSFLEGCGVIAQICSTTDLAEMVYYSLNRKRASKARFQDVNLQEMLALYCTSEQDAIRIQKVIDELKQETAQSKQTPAPFEEEMKEKVEPVITQTPFVIQDHLLNQEQLARQVLKEIGEEEIEEPYSSPSHSFEPNKQIPDVEKPSTPTPMEEIEAMENFLHGVGINTVQDEELFELVPPETNRENEKYETSSQKFIPYNKRNRR